MLRSKHVFSDAIASSILSHNLGTTDGSSQQSLSTLPCLQLPKLAGNVHSLILSSHFFFYLPRIPFPFTVPCRIVFAKPEDLETWPNHVLYIWSMVKDKFSHNAHHKIRPNKRTL